LTPASRISPAKEVTNKHKSEQTVIEVMIEPFSSMGKAYSNDQINHSTQYKEKKYKFGLSPKYDSYCSL